MRAAAALAGWLALSGSALLPFVGARFVETVDDLAEPLPEDPGRHLAVVVPVYRGDLSRAVSSLERWPSLCSPLTEKNADLVLYYAEGEEDAPAVTAAVETIRETAGHCFAETRLVYAHLSDEEDVYPKGPSVMFFKMFLDESVHASLSEYDALAIIEWDVLVASDRSFEELHHAAFRGNEDFWVKGSNLGGTNFHSTAQVSDMWKVLGHINGNAIYNNNDPDFVEYVDYTRTRWGYTYPYDVALWLTISDFPYSWPLWQRYSSKFVTTNLISYVGTEHVDHSTVSDAVAGQTLFVHGSRVDEGNLASLKATKHERKQTRASVRRLSDDIETPPPACNAACGSETISGLPVGTSTVCDDTCAGKFTRFGGFLCGAGDSDRFGSMCRLCFVDVEEARRQEQSLALTRSDIEGGEEASRIIMCDTMRPPEAAGCSDKCGRKKDTVCDEACGTGRHGDYNCSWRNHGPKCRFCFNDLEAALMADEVAKRRGGRVIMCSTFEPPQAKTLKADLVHIASRPGEGLEPAVVNVGSLARTSPSRMLQTNFCDEECPYTNSNGFRGRVCDPSCADGVPFGTNGCGAREGRHGDLCRACYIDVQRAQNNDGPDNRAIMYVEQVSDEPFDPANSCDEAECPYTNSVGFRGRVCDPSCADGIPFGTYGCGTRQGRHGGNCRLCFNDENRARNNDSPQNRAIMCDTLMPVPDETVDPAGTCDEEECPYTNSIGFRGRVCDPSCASGIPFGTNGCGTRDGRHGSNCRLCYNDADRALRNDDPDDRAIMCDTLMPVPDEPVEPEEPVESCDEEECPYTNSIGFRGRVCDPSCADGIPFGTNGCGTRDGRHGPNCRLCYNDDARARSNDDPNDRAIMCDTLMPVPDEPVEPEEPVESCDEEECPYTNSIGFRGRVCDPSCADGIPFGTNGCGTRDGRHGPNCRLCYNDDARARSNDDPNDRAIMCDTLMPVSDEPVDTAGTCDEEECPYTNSIGFRGRVCDPSCATGIPFGTNGCNTREGRHGSNCRLCYNDVDRALANDDPDDRAIMCATMEPVNTTPYGEDSRRLGAVPGGSAPLIAKMLKAWKKSPDVVGGVNEQSAIEETATTSVVQVESLTSSPPPRKLQANFCDEECPYTNSNGFRGRVCDPSCADGVPFGTNGCGAREGRHGDLCRACYIDVQRAQNNDGPDNRAIMCDTLLPVSDEPFDPANSCDEAECPYTNSVGFRGRVCDPSCADGIPFGTYGCGTRQGRHGGNCRLCFNDENRARNNDSPQNRAIMCDTLMPVPDETVDPAGTCDEEECPYTNSIGFRGRVCDPSCASGIPFGTNGCGTRDGRHGSNCRLCYNDADRALRNDDPDDRAIMCDTLMPVPDEPVEPEEPVESCDEEECPYTNSIGFRGRVCDPSCADGIPFGTNGCGTRDGRHGPNCRLCYNDDARARSNDDPNDRAIMCDTLMPVSDEPVDPAGTCDEEECPYTNSIGFRGRVCDPSCATGIPFGTNGCNTREGRHGSNCRLCYNDVDRAVANDDPDDRAIMCDSLMPVSDQPVDPAGTCDEEECPYTNSVGFRGRVCDPSCANGMPFGTNGCGTRNGRHGSNCRLCYNDVDRALANDDPDDRAIMCDTLEPAQGAYDIRRLSTAIEDSPRHQLSAFADAVDGVQSMFDAATILPYTNDLVRGNICAFIAGDVEEVDQVEVAVMSVLQFLPGMRVAVATDNAGFHAYQRSVGVLPGVTVHPTDDPYTASLLADEYCGVDTRLIFYMKSDSVVSRQFTSKDTHSTHGDLLVVHGSQKGSFADRDLTELTTTVLGFQSPSFTFNADLFLPVGANGDLREVLVSGQDNETREGHGSALDVLRGFMKQRKMSAVPQLMAALAYSRNIPGVWFVDPQTWVSQHLFRTASIWEIPLVKPRFTCSIDPLARKTYTENMDVALVLQSNLDFFTHGGTCDSGYIDTRRVE